MKGNQSKHKIIYFYEDNPFLEIQIIWKWYSNNIHLKLIWIFAGTLQWKIFTIHDAAFHYFQNIVICFSIQNCMELKHTSIIEIPVAKQIQSNAFNFVDVLLTCFFRRCSSTCQIHDNMLITAIIRKVIALFYVHFLIICNNYI